MVREDQLCILRVSATICSLCTTTFFSKWVCTIASTSILQPFAIVSRHQQVLNRAMTRYRKGPSEGDKLKPQIRQSKFIVEKNKQFPVPTAVGLVEALSTKFTKEQLVTIVLIHLIGLTHLMHFILFLGETVPPSGRNGSFLNRGQHILSSNENILIFGATWSENSVPMQRYVKHLLQEMISIEDKSSRKCVTRSMRFFSTWNSFTTRC